MPERPWGSPFKAYPPGRSRACHQATALMPLRRPLPLFSSEVEKRTRGIDRLQSLALRPEPHPACGPKDANRAGALLGLSLPRVFSPPDRRSQAANSRTLQRPASARRGPSIHGQQPASRSITSQAGRNDLSRGLQPFQGFPPTATLRMQTAWTHAVWFSGQL